MPDFRQLQCLQVRGNERMQTQLPHALRYIERIVTTNEGPLQLFQGSHDLVT